MQTVSVLKDVHTHGIACLAFDLDGQVCNEYSFFEHLNILVLCQKSCYVAFYFFKQVYSLWFYLLILKLRGKELALVVNDKYSHLAGKV